MIERAFVYGDFIFETIAFRDGVLCNLDLHTKRLALGFELLQFEATANEADIRDLLFSKLSNKQHARIRLIAYRESDGFYLPNKNKVGYQVAFFELPALVSEISEIGFYTDNKKPCNPISSLKNTSSILSVLASKYAAVNALGDVVIFNQYERVCETTNSNLFYVKDGVLITPSLSEGCVHGIQRQIVLRKALEVGITIRETEVEKADLTDADEIFITNTIQPLRTIKQIEGRVLENRIGNLIRENLGV